MDKLIARVHIRKAVLDVLKDRVSSSEKDTAKWFLDCLKDYNCSISAAGVIKASGRNRFFTPVLIGSDVIRRIYDDADFKEVETFEEFVFRFNGIWIKTFVSLLKEWNEKYGENNETAF